MIYNGLGHIIRWIIVTDGSQLSDDFAIQNGPSVMLLKTEDGLLSATTVKSVLILVKRYKLLKAFVCWANYLVVVLKIQLWKHCPTKFKDTYCILYFFFIVIFREMTTLGLEGPAFVYLDVFASQQVNFIVWKYCWKSNINMMAIPRKIFWSMKPFRLGAMGKYSHRMLFYMYHR